MIRDYVIFWKKILHSLGQRDETTINSNIYIYIYIYIYIFEKGRRIRLNTCTQS